jgi:hypothetical protein
VIAGPRRGWLCFPVLAKSARVASRVRGSGTYDVPPRDFQLRNASPSAGRVYRPGLANALLDQLLPPPHARVSTRRSEGAAARRRRIRGITREGRRRGSGGLEASRLSETP